MFLIKCMAEREGFEPPVPLRVRLISSQVHSTGLCHLSAPAPVYNNCGEWRKRGALQTSLLRQ